MLKQVQVFSEEHSYSTPILKINSEKKVRFSEDTKKHDGISLEKDITELIVHAFFDKKLICIVPDIQEILQVTYGPIQTNIYINATKYLKNVFKRVKLIKKHDYITTVPLFKDTVGHHNIKLGKIHEPHLEQLIRLFKCSRGF